MEGEEFRPYSIGTVGDGGLPNALIEGIEWPSGSNRSVVVMALRDASVIPSFLTVFLKTSQSSDILQSLSVLQGQKFTSYQIGNDVNHVGSLSVNAWIGFGVCDGLGQRWKRSASDSFPGGEECGGNGKL